MGNVFEAKAFDATQEVPTIRLRDGRELRGRPVSFAAARKLDLQQRQMGELPEAERFTALYDFTVAALTAMHLPADEVLEDLTVEEVTEAVQGFFSFRPTLSGRTEGTASPVTSTSHGTTGETR